MTIQWVVKHPKGALIISCLLSFLAASGLNHFSFEEDTRKLFSTNDRERAILEEFEASFGSVDFAFVALESKHADIFTIENLQVLKDLTDAVADLPYAIRVESLATYQHSYADGDSLVIEPLIDDMELSAEDLAEKKAIALNEASLVSRLISVDGKVAGIIVDLNFINQNIQTAKQHSVFYLRDLARAFEARHPDVEVYLSGDIIFTQALLDSVVADGGVLSALYVITFAMLGLLFRSILAMVAIFVVALCSAIGAFGMAGWFGISLSSLSAFSVNVIMPVAVAYSVHLVSVFFNEYRRPADKKSAIIRAFNINQKPIFIATLTTFIGFFSMNLSGLPAYAAFGNTAAFGVLMTLMLLQLFLPAFLMLVPIRPKPEGLRGLRRALDRIASSVLANRGITALTTLSIAVILCGLALTNVVNEEYTKQIDQDNEAIRDNQFIDKHFGAYFTFEYELGADGPGGISDTAYLEHLSRFSDWLRKHPTITNVYSYSDVMKRLHKSMSGGELGTENLPDSRELAAQYQLLFEMSLPAGMDLGSLINEDSSATRLVVTFPSTDSLGVYELRAEIKQWMTNNLPQRMQHDGTSLTIMITHAATAVLYNSITGGLLAVILITVVLAVVLKSIKLALLSLIPNLLPVGAGFGIWALINGQMGISLFIVFGISIGIVVDDTVHFIKKYQDGREELGMAPEEAVRYAYQTVGPAIIITTIVLCLGFGFWTFSQITGNSQIGMLTAIIIAAALLLDLLLLPLLLLWADDANRGQSADRERSPAPVNLPQSRTI